MQKYIAWIWDLLKTLAIAGFVAFFLIRGFIFEPYRIPSGSMEPTLLKGDFLIVTKFSYGNRLPLTDYFFWQKPVTRGDIVVFKRQAPYLPGSFFGFGDVLFIKRVVGVPGDKIAYKNKRLFINGQEAPLTNEADYTYVQRSQLGNQDIAATQFTETLPNRTHQMAYNPAITGVDVAETTVPAGQYVVIGDNRDNSRDSRFWNYPAWGFLPQKDVMGKAQFIFWSWEDNFKPRLERLGNSLKAPFITPTP